MNDQRSTYDQLLDLMRLANDNGLYDAADYLSRLMPEPPGDVNYIGFDPIHNWFGLTYANYLVIARSLLQSMPLRWQWRMVACLNEINEYFGPKMEGTYSVQLRDKRGRFIKDDLNDYQRGRRVIEPYQPSSSPENKSAPIEPTTGLPSLLTPAAKPPPFDPSKPFKNLRKPGGMA